MAQNLIATVEKPIIKATDMDEDLRKNVEQIAAQALQTICPKKETGMCPEREIANYITEQLEKIEEYGWNCVVGRSFGSHIVHQTKKYIFFQMVELSILVWKA